MSKIIKMQQISPENLGSKLNSFFDTLNPLQSFDKSTELLDISEQIKDEPLCYQLRPPKKWCSTLEQVEEKIKQHGGRIICSYFNMPSLCLVFVLYNPKNRTDKFYKLGIMSLQLRKIQQVQEKLEQIINKYVEKNNKFTCNEIILALTTGEK